MVKICVHSGYDDRILFEYYAFQIPNVGDFITRNNIGYKVDSVTHVISADENGKLRLNEVRVYLR